MMKKNQLILGLAALVAVGVVSSVVTWLIVRDNGGKAAAPATAATAAAARVFAAVGGPPDDPGKIADDKKAKGDKTPADATATRVGAPNPQPADQCDPNGPPTAFAEWRFTPDTFEKTKGKAKTIVLGEVTSVQAGPDQVIAMPQEPGGEIRTPTQTVEVKVMKSYKGSDKKAGDTVTLSQVGNACVRVANDPSYVKGETTLLMLEDGPRGTMQTISPEGRYKKGPDGTLNPVIDNAATAKLKGKKVEDVEAMLR